MIHMSNQQILFSPSLFVLFIFDLKCKHFAHLILNILLYLKIHVLRSIKIQDIHALHLKYKIKQIYKYIGNSTINRNLLFPQQNGISNLHRQKRNAAIGKISPRQT